MRYRALPPFILLTFVVLAVSPCMGAQRDSRLPRAQSLIEEAQKDIQAGRAQQAIPKAREALDLREQALGPSHPWVAGALMVLGRAFQDSGDLTGARAALERALAIREQALGPTQAEVAATLNSLGWVLYYGGDYVEAKPILERALAIFQQAVGPTSLEASHPLSGLGALAAATGDYAAARSAHEQALAIREQALGPTHVGVAAALDELGMTRMQAGDPEAARPLFERALAIREAAHGPDHPQVAQSLTSLGWALNARGDRAGANRAFERALAICQKATSPQPLRTARALYGLGVIAAATGDFPAARAAYEQALAIRERAKGESSIGVAEVLTDYGTLLRVLGDYAGARTALERALTIQEQARGPSHPAVAGVLTDYGALLRWLGDYAGAEAALMRALAIRERSFGTDHRSVAGALYQLAQTQAAAGRGGRARASADRALQISERALGPNHPFVADTLALVANRRAAGGDFAGAKPLCERALKIYEGTVGPEHRLVAIVLADLARIYQASGDRTGARQALERSLVIRERALGPEHLEVAGTLNGLGGLFLEEGNTSAAQPLFARSFAIANKANAPRFRMRAAMGLGRIRELGQHWAQAATFYRSAVKDLEGLAGQFEDEAQRVQFLKGAGGLGVYDALARVLLKLHEQDQSRGHDQEAWAILDAKKKRFAAETLGAAQPAPQDPKARAELQSAQAKRDQALALERNLREEQAKAAQEQQPEEIRNLTTQLARTKAQYLAQVQGFLQRYPKYKSQFIDQQTVDPKALAKFAERLPKDTLAVQYFAAPDQLYLFVVAPGGKFQVKAQAVTQEKLFGLVKQVRELIERGVDRMLPWRDDGSEVYRRDVVPLKAALRELSEHLLKPIESELQPSRGLVLIPNDLLFYFPFPALTREAPDGTVRFLAETHAVSYVTQLELTDLLGPGAAAPDAPLLALANPDGSLPGASREVRALVRIRPTITTLDGPQATKERFLSQVGRFPDLHLATHGVLDPQRPEQSYLLLAGADEPSQRLGIGEIAGLSLPGGLTVLSACETALGEQVPGAALITLAAAFSQAGSQSIVASLWKVNDVATRDFMVAFYGSLSSGRAAALHRAQLNLLANPATAHPFSWALFILIGAR